MKLFTVGKLEAKIYKDNKLITTIGNMEKIYLKFNPKLNLWTGKWPIPYNPDLGRYNVLVRALPNNPGPVITDTASFNIMGRIPKKMNESICAALLEFGGGTVGRNFVGPDETEGDWRNVIKWVDYVGANSFFMLGAETAIYGGVNKENPFLPEKLKEMETVAKEVKKTGLKFGAWVMTFGIQGIEHGDGYEKVGYSPSMAFDNKSQSVYPSHMHVSLIDEKRINDLVKVIKRFNENTDIDYIGFDYIRTGSADGFELADLVVRDMSIAVPNNWEDMASQDRMVWFANKIQNRDPEIIEKWQWWRAHKVAEIINKIITLAKVSKPVWVFTLGWEHGKQHGQDPLMFMDAGVYFDAVMLYEANQVQFRSFLNDWKGYVASSQVNIIVGQTVDVHLLDSDVLNPPEELVRRIDIGSKKIVFGGLTDGVFWHDVSRAYWGNKGGFTPKEWFLTAGKSFSDYRIERGEVGTKLSIDVRNNEYSRRDYYVDAILENQTINQINNVQVECINTQGVTAIGGNTKTIEQLAPGEIKIITFQVHINANLGKYKYMIAVGAKSPTTYKVIDFQYVNPNKYYGKK